MQQRSSKQRASHRPSLSHWQCAHAHVHVVQTIDTRRAWSTGIHEHQSINWALLVMVFTAEVLTRTEVLTAEERGPNTAIQGYFLTHACAANV